MEYGGRFGPLDTHVVRRAAMTIALELEAERRVAVASGDALAALGADLLRGDRDEPSLERRARHIGVDLTVPRVVCLVAPDDPEGEAPAVADVVAALGDAGEPALTAAVDDGVVALLDVAAGSSALDAMARLRDRVEAALPRVGDGLVVALSTRCAGPADYPRAHREAREVLRVLRTFGAHRAAPVLSADDLGPCRLLLSASQRADADRFARDALGALLDGDEGIRDLLVTLRAFFDAGRSVRRSALALDVHENTIRYRLTRIEELTGLAVGSDSDDQLSAHLALLVLRLQGEVPAG
jgi:sugar diacid utilization regulator